MRVTSPKAAPHDRPSREAIAADYGAQGRDFLDTQTQPFARPMVRQTLASQAAVQIKEDLIQGRLKPGQSLREVGLARALAVSQGVIREALRQLHGEGLVSLAPHLGASVRRLSLQDVRDLYEVRIANETLALQLIRARRPSLKPLWDDVAEMRSKSLDHDIVALSISEAKFHFTLLELSGNHFLAEVGARLRDITSIALTVDNQRYDDPTVIATEHAALMQTIESVDALSHERLEQEIRGHIMSSLETFPWH